MQINPRKPFIIHIIIAVVFLVGVYVGNRFSPTVQRLKNFEAEISYDIYWDMTMAGRAASGIGYRDDSKFLHSRAKSMGVYCKSLSTRLEFCDTYMGFTKLCAADRKLTQTQYFTLRQFVWDATDYLENLTENNLPDELSEKDKLTIVQIGMILQDFEDPSFSLLYQRLEEFQTEYGYSLLGIPIPTM